MKKTLIALALFASPLMAENLASLETACNGGDQDACLRGTQVSQADGDTAMMVRFVNQGCRLGNTISCADKGMMLVLGIGGTKDVEQALPLITKSCDDGYSRACANLGWMHFSGTGVPRDIRRAALLYEQGCNGISGAACANLAQMYKDGQMHSVDGDKITYLINRACTLGHQPAC